MISYTIKPLKTKKDYHEALRVFKSVFHAPIGTPESDLADVLATLIERYEDEHYKLPHPDPIGAIECRMDDLGLTVNDLGKIIGYKTRASEILHRKRKLTLGMIRKLSDKLSIPLSVLVQDYELSK